MPSPFPGMDPWLERPALWPDVHLNLIIRLQNALVPLVSPKYYIAVRQRTVSDFLPPVPALSRHNVSATKLTDHTKSAQKPLRESAVLTEPIIVEVPVREKITEDYLEVVEAATHEAIAAIIVVY